MADKFVGYYNPAEAEAERIEIFSGKLLEYRAAQNWQGFINIALAAYEVLPLAFTYYEEIPDHLKYDFAIRAYENHGDSLESVRNAVINAGQYGRPELPAELRDKEVITIYRAGEEDPTRCKERLSWTTSLETALFFMYEYRGRHAEHLYKGEIRTADIIAYTNDRNENEVLQYNKVFNVVELPTE